VVAEGPPQPFEGFRIEALEHAQGGELAFPQGFLFPGGLLDEPEEWDDPYRFFRW